MTWWASLLVATLLTAGAPPAELGPRISLTAVDQPLGEVLEAIGRQCNRRFTGGVVDDPARLTRPVSLTLDRATVGQTLDRLGELLATRPTARSRTEVVLDRTSPPREYLTVTLDQWQVKLAYLRFYFSHVYYPAEPTRSTATSWLQPTLTILAPDDVEACWLHDIRPPRATTDAGSELPALSPSVSLTAPTDPRLWSFTSNIAAPGRDARELARLSLELIFCRSLTPHRLACALADGPRTQTADGYTLEWRPSSSGRSSGTVQFTGPVPAGWEKDNARLLLNRDGWLWARFLDAEGRALLTDQRLDQRTVKDGQWQIRWRIGAASEPWVGRRSAGETPPATRVELAVHAPGPPAEPVVVAFDRLPLPPRERSAAP